MNKLMIRARQVGKTLYFKNELEAFLKRGSLKTYPWYINFCLFFCKKHHSYDSETRGLDWSKGKDFSVLITYKRFNGVTYIISEEIL